MCSVHVAVLDAILGAGSVIMIVQQTLWTSRALVHGDLQSGLSSNFKYQTAVLCNANSSPLSFNNNRLLEMTPDGLLQ